MLHGSGLLVLLCRRDVVRVDDRLEVFFLTDCIQLRWLVLAFPSGEVLIDDFSLLRNDIWLARRLLAALTHNVVVVALIHDLLEELLTNFSSFIDLILFLDPDLRYDFLQLTFDGPHFDFLVLWVRRRTVRLYIQSLPHAVGPLLLVAL